MKKQCDMCGSAIIDKECSCGYWLTPEEVKDNCMKKSIEDFHEMKQFTFTGDMPHLGCAVIYFRGDYNDCKKVEKFIHRMKGRPYYENSKS